MMDAQKQSTACKEESSVQEMLQCRQRQWNSGLCKDAYCTDCLKKEECFEILGR